MTIYTRQNRDGESVNESALCEDCLEIEDALDESYWTWAEQRDVDQETNSPEFHPADNHHAHCTWCGVEAVY